jgi:hypothetical protein
MERIQQTYERLGAPSAKQLRFALVREGVQISPAEATSFVNKQQENQIFAKKPQADGKVATRGPGESMSIDLIDLKQFGNSNKMILVAMDNFSRKVALEGLASKKPGVVAEGFKKILERMPKPADVTSDNGNEWRQVDAILRSEGIVHKYKRSITSMARLDRGIARLKDDLFARLARKGDLKWDSLLPPVESAYNEKLMEVIGFSPDDAAKDPVIQFRVLEEEADAFVHNDRVNTRLTKQLEEAGAFRKVIPPTAFDRSFKPRYGELKEVAKVERGQVVDQQGNRYAVKEVKAVDKDTVQRPVPDMTGRGLRDKRLREQLQRYADELYEMLGDRSLSFTSASRMMSEGFAETKPTTMTFGDFVRLFKDKFTVEGQLTQSKVRRARRRKVGKQKP